VKAAVWLIAALLAGPVAAAARSDVPLVLKRRVADGVTYVDSWAMLHEVRGLKAGGDGFLSVREGPATDFAERDRLTNGRTVILFERRGDWAGVIYPAKAEHDLETIAAACGFDEAAARVMPSRKTYDGPCSWGWVHRRWLVNLSD
jgi:hypothetical protein